VVVSCDDDVPSDDELSDDVLDAVAVEAVADDELSAGSRPAAIWM
jgi:hypothetical protein